MTPQTILEDMLAFELLSGSRLEEFFDIGMWRMAKEVVTQAVHFEFASSTPRTEHVEFANEMMERDMFRLPFSAVLYTGDCIPKTGIVAEQVSESGKPLEGLSWFVVAPAMDRDGNSYSLPLMVAQLDARDHASGLPTSMARGTVDWKSMTTMPHASRKTGRVWGEEDYHAGSEKALQMIMGGTALMMSKDVDVRVDVAPAKLNAKRLAQGKPEVRERRVILIRPEHRDKYKDMSTAFGQTKASPRMHWRRGHFRRVRDDLIVPVAPSLVGAREGVAIAQPKAYEVSQ